jgi:PKD repeat protein
MSISGLSGLSGLSGEIDAGSDLDDASFHYSSATYCNSDDNPTPTVTGLAGGTFTCVGTSINSVTGTLDINPLGTFTVTYTTNGPHPNSSHVDISSVICDDASFSYSSGTYCQSGSPQTPIAIATPGGTFSSTPGGLSLNPTTGTITLSTSSLGSYEVTYTPHVESPFNSSSIAMTITNTTPLTAFHYAHAFCQDDANPFPIFNPGASAGLFTSQAGAFHGGFAVFKNVNTGEIDLNATTPDSYNIINTISASGSCDGSADFSVLTVYALDDASFSYDNSSYCQPDSNPTPTITGMAGGVFSSTAGLLINPSTGTIILVSSTPGAYDVTYSTNGTCPNSSSVAVTILGATASFTANPTDLAVGDIVNFTNNSIGSSYDWDFGDGSIHSTSTNPSHIYNVDGTFTVVLTTNPGGGPCEQTATQAITVNLLDDASFAYTSATYCTTGSNPTPVITGLPGGNFVGTPAGLNLNPSTGTINLPISALGPYTVTYTTNGDWPNISAITITIRNTAPSADFSYSGSPFCQNGNNPSPVFASDKSAGYFTSSAGLVFVSVNTGQIDLAASTPGTYMITNTIPVSGGCSGATANTTIVISSSDDASFVYTSATYCTSGSPQTPSITGVPGGTFSSTPAGLSLNPSTGTITLSTSTLGQYVLTYTTNGSCPNTSSIIMTITDTPSAVFSYSGSPFCQNGNNPLPNFSPGTSAGVFTPQTGFAHSQLMVLANVNTGEIDLAATTPDQYNVINTIPASGDCEGVAEFTTIIITALDDASFNYGASSYCQSDSNPTPTITGLAGGAFYALPPGISINPSTGTINPSSSNVGTYIITYTTNGTCPNSSSVNITINDCT